MGKFYVVEVVYTPREGGFTFFRKYEYAGPFNTELEAQLIADEKNAAVQEPSKSMSFYHVGTGEEIGVAGIIAA